MSEAGFKSTVALPQVRPGKPGDGGALLPLPGGAARCGGDHRGAEPAPVD